MQTINKAIEVYGKDAQCLQAMEELAELQVEISHAMRGRDNHVEEEIADVEIMLEQLKVMFDCTDVEKIKRQKLDRLQERMEQKCMDSAMVEVDRLWRVKCGKYDSPDKATCDRLWKEAVFECNASLEINGGKF